MTEDGLALLATVRAIAPEIAARAPEIEEARTLPAQIVAMLRDVGLYRMFTPRVHGGIELPFPDSLPILIELAAADGATGWTAMLGSHTPLHFSMLPRATYDRIYADTPDVMAAGTYPPKGSAVAIDGGYRISGRWPFASGCRHADYLYAGTLLSGPAGGMRTFVRPAEQWIIHDSWHTQGLRGTGSNDIEIRDADTPADWMYDLFSGQPCVPGPLYGHGVPLVITHIGAVALGIAKGALADCIAMTLAAKKRPVTEHAPADHPVLHFQLGRAEADYKAAHAYLTAATEAQWQRILSGEQHAAAAMHDSMQATMWTVETCTKVVLAAHDLAGSRAIFSDQPIQRRLRDITTLRHHNLIQSTLWAVAGEAALGRTVLNSGSRIY